MHLNDFQTNEAFAFGLADEIKNCTWYNNCNKGIINSDKIMARDLPN